MLLFRFIPIIVGYKLRDYSCLSGDFFFFLNQELCLRVLKTSLGETLLSVFKLPGFLTTDQGWERGLCLTQGSTSLCLPVVGAPETQKPTWFSPTLPRAARTAVALSIRMTLEL